MLFGDKDLKKARIDAEAEFRRLEIQASAKDVAGKAIGRYGLLCITIIVLIGVGASLYLDESKIAAVIGLVSAALTALIAMLNGIAGASPKQEKPEFEIMRELIARLDRMADRDPMAVHVEGDKVTVHKGDNKMTTKRGGE